MVKSNYVAGSLKNIIEIKNQINKNNAVDHFYTEQGQINIFNSKK